MSYLLGAYGFAFVALVGYVIYVVRQTRAAAAKLRDAEMSPPLRDPLRGESGR
jgi:Heme exporter protein D (CcmD)